MSTDERRLTTLAGLESEAEALAIALEAAEAGARVLVEESRHARGARPSFETKASGIDLVTAIDRASEAAVLDVLGRRSAGRAAIVAEEGGGSGDRSDRALPVWYVDPLDGTTNYAHGHPFCAVSIGLAIDGVARVGVVHAPFLGLVWCGTSSHAVRRDLLRGTERELGVSAVARVDDALLATGFPYDRRSSPDDNLAPHNAAMKRAHGVMRCGAASIDLALVADGTYDAFWERKLKPWDLAGAAPLLAFAGGTITDPWGRPFWLEEGALLASNGLVHAEMLALLAAHLPEAPSRGEKAS
jgi:myo-inositol-1(or 4)-monophosphatase